MYLSIKNYLKNNHNLIKKNKLVNNVFKIKVGSLIFYGFLG